MTPTTDCYGRTNGGTACELPAGHYPNTQHLVSFGGDSWMSWTDESMQEFADIGIKMNACRSGQVHEYFEKVPYMGQTDFVTECLCGQPREADCHG